MQLDELPNVYVEFGAVINELGRQPFTARKFFIEYQDKFCLEKTSIIKEKNTTFIFRCWKLQMM